MKNKIIVILVAIIVLLVSVIAAPTLKDMLADKDTSSLSEMNETMDIKQTENNDGAYQNTTENNSKNKPLLIAIDYYMSGELYTRESYDYDSEGRVIGYCLEDPIGSKNEHYNFVYNGDGKVISQRHKYGGYTYEYDKNGNCIKKISKLDNGDELVYSYDYDEYNNIIKETRTEGDYYKYTVEKKLTYENGKCVQAETTSKVNGDVWEGVETYEYDENGNIYSVSKYEDYSSGNDKTLVVNGAVYYLYETAYYTYKNFDSAVSSDEAISNQANAQNTTTVEKRLSDECDKNLVSGYDAENNFYELVANEFEDYSGTTIEIGVIKNNKWIIPVTTDYPFDLMFKSIYDKNAGFAYTGNGCFFHGRVFWNVNNGKTYTANGYKAGVSKSVYCNEGKVILAKGGENFRVLDTNTMSIKEINLLCSYDIAHLYPYVDGLFACMNTRNGSKVNGFYDLNGNKVIDLSKYNFVDTISTIDFVFIDGKCSFKIYNDQNSVYMITIDKTGEVIDSYKVS